MSGSVLSSGHVSSDPKNMDPVPESLLSNGEIDINQKTQK